MGHLTGKDIYRRLGAKVDAMPTRAPWNDRLHDILRTLYTVEEADLVLGMPYGPATLDQIARATHIAPLTLARRLESLCAKGLIMDLWIEGEYRYMISPLMIGFFEFTMMRTGPDLDTAEWARLFHAYFQHDGSFFEANAGSADRVFITRVLPHEESLEEFTEVLDYEKAAAIVDRADQMAVGLCSCRHEKEHAGVKSCDTPLDTCASFGFAADYLIRRRMARAVSKSEMLDNLDRSRSLGLVLEADNVQNRVRFLCQCCGCCCNVLLGLTRYGHPNILMTSNYIARHHEDPCIGCGRCAQACPIQAISMHATAVEPDQTADRPVVDESICLGCGVCGVKCPTGAITLVRRPRRVLHPETTFERVILQSLEKGTLQNQVFDAPHRLTHEFMRTLLGAFLNLTPVKKALMSDLLRSTFLKTVSGGVKLLGKGWVTRL